MFNAIRVNTDEHDERRGERECIDTDRTKDFPHGSRSLSRETPLFDPSLGSKRAHRTRTESERAKGARDVHLLTGDEKTVVLSRERFAADNQAARSLRTSPTLASKPFDYAYIAYVQPRAGGEKIAGEKNSNFPKSYSPLEIHPLAGTAYTLLRTKTFRVSRI